MDANLILFIQSVINGIFNGSVYGLVALGLTMIFGVMNIVNFAHGALYMVGMYVAYWMFALFGITPYLSLPIVFIFLFILGASIQRGLINPLLKGEQTNQLLVCIGVVLLLENLALFFFSANFRTITIEAIRIPLRLGYFSISLPRLIALIFAVAFCIGLFLFLKKSKWGMAIRATAQDADAASLMGINVNFVYILTFGLGAALAGSAGALVLPFFYVSPDVGHVYLLLSFVIVVLGGLGNAIGAVVGGLLLGIGESVAAAFLGGTWEEMFIFGVFALVLLLKPEGIFGGGMK